MNDFINKHVMGLVCHKRSPLQSFYSKLQLNQHNAGTGPESGLALRFESVRACLNSLM